MMRIYLDVCYKYRKFESLTISHILKKHQIFILFAVNEVMIGKKIFKEESTEILKIIG